MWCFIDPPPLRNFWYADPHRDRGDAARFDRGRFGLLLFVASLAVLFGASIVAYVIIRQKVGNWPPAGTSRGGAGMWLSTLVLALSSYTMHAALQAARADRRRALAVYLATSTFLGLGYLANQVWLWNGLLAGRLPIHVHLYAFFFYLLTVLHAAHVLGGLIPMGVVTTYALRGRYTRERHAGVRYCTLYWHFLGGVWAVLFGLLVLLP